jgi:hypothetical protein
LAAKVDWHQGDLFPRVRFIVNNLRGGAASVFWFYNGCGTAEPWIRVRWDSSMGQSPISAVQLNSVLRTPASAMVATTRTANATHSNRHPPLILAQPAAPPFHSSLEISLKLFK